MSGLNIRQKLMRIQVELKAPKNLYNSFGKYKYRNAEGIQEALKPLEKEYNVTTILSDSVEEVGGRVYICASATFSDCDSGDVIIVKAYAREANEKKGMDDAQVTGASSSYARKYALNGLFLLDDTKDVDTEEYQEQAKKATTKKVEKKSSRDLLREFCQENYIEPSTIVKACNLKPDSTEEEWAKALEYAKKNFGA